MTSTKVDANSYYITDLETYNSGKVARISSDAVAKPVFLYGASELFTTNTIRNCTQIPVPFCERVVRGTANRWLVQQYIPGRTVCSLWPVLGWWKRFRIVLTLRYYVHLLRAFSAPQSIPLFPGPLSIDGKPQICNGRLFTGTGPGPFTNYCELSKWYQNRLIFMRNIFKTGFDVGPFDDSLPLVFTHLDLHPLNLILGDDGQLWVIDCKLLAGIHRGSNPQVCSCLLGGRQGTFLVYGIGKTGSLSLQDPVIAPGNCLSSKRLNIPWRIFGRTSH